MANIKEKKQKKLYITGSGDVTASRFFITSSLETAASKSFAEAQHINNRVYFNTNKAIIYQLKLMEQDIDEIHGMIENKNTDVNGGSF